MKKYKYKYQIIYQKETCRQTGNVKSSPLFEDELQATALFDKTHRTASLWKTWNDEIKGERWEKLKFKVVYAKQELAAMHPNMIKGKVADYYQYMTAETQKRVKAIAKQKNIRLSIT